MASNLPSLCTVCGNGVGYPEIHEAIHYLIDNGDIPNDPDPHLRNGMIFEVMNYLSFFKNKFLQNQSTANFLWANSCTQIQRVDRELRHVLQPRKRSKIAADLEIERTEHHRVISKETHESDKHIKNEAWN